MPATPKESHPVPATPKESHPGSAAQARVPGVSQAHHLGGLVELEICRRESRLRAHLSRLRLDVARLHHQRARVKVEELRVAARARAETRGGGARVR